MMDVLQATIDLLKADAGVQALVTNGEPAGATYRVYGQELPQDQVASMPRHAVVLRRVPGIGGAKGTVRLEEGVLAAACYGETFADAEELRGAVRDCLRNMTRRIVSETLLHSFEPATAPTPQREPDTKWPVIVEDWTFLASEVQAA
jgi:hypothetical protein